MSSIFLSLKEVFKKPQYAVCAGIIAVIVVCCMIFIQNIAFLKTVWGIDMFSLRSKAYITAESLNAFHTNLSALSQFFHIVIAVLIAVDITFLVYYFRKRRTIERAAGISVIGMLSGIIGIGCSVCGSVVLSSLLGLSVATTIITALPFRGIEFSVLSILILIFSIGYLGVKLQEPVVCRNK